MLEKHTVNMTQSKIPAISVMTVAIHAATQEIERLVLRLRSAVKKLIKAKKHAIGCRTGVQERLYTAAVVLS